MALFSLSDPHLSFGVEKPMDIFGGSWQGYVQKLEKEWLRRVSAEDTVVLGGDISWGISLEEAREDFVFLSRLPGRKIIVKGNHDLWWTSVSKMNTFLENMGIFDIHFLYNNHFAYGDIGLCGSRGWLFPSQFKDENDPKIYRRELLRLEASLAAAKKAGHRRLFVFLHYPPLYQSFVATEFMELMGKYGVERCIYGHLHSQSLSYAPRGQIENIEFSCVSGDFINFSPFLLEK